LKRARDAPLLLGKSKCIATRPTNLAPLHVSRDVGLEIILFQTPRIFFG
jgi:hypothetical protein